MDLKHQQGPNKEFTAQPKGVYGRKLPRFYSWVFDASSLFIELFLAFFLKGMSGFEVPKGLIMEFTA